MQVQIQEILNREGLSSSQFADRIGIQRSSVSHVLSGRNKPGFDFIQKILIAFPEINGDWLITGSGDMYKQKRPPEELFDDKVSIQTDDSTSKADKKPVETSEKKTVRSRIEEKGNRAIERVIVFYNDRTFREYDAESTI
jgi:transcriptional regulator with XRE-family HTH domain